ncbi:hypothetical protein [Streptomyces sennicomposti]
MRVGLAVDRSAEPVAVSVTATAVIHCSKSLTAWLANEHQGRMPRLRVAVVRDRACLRAASPDELPAMPIT